MIITKRKKSKSELNPKKLQGGTVFKFQDGVVGLKVEKDVVLLKHSSGNDWLTMAEDDPCYGIDGNESVAEILGEIVEIIVE